MLTLRKSISGNGFLYILYGIEEEKYYMLNLNGVLRNNVEEKKKRGESKVGRMNTTWEAK